KFAPTAFERALAYPVGAPALHQHLALIGRVGKGTHITRTTRHRDEELMIAVPFHVLLVGAKAGAESRFAPFRIDLQILSDIRLEPDHPDQRLLHLRQLHEPAV